MYTKDEYIYRGIILRFDGMWDKRPDIDIWESEDRREVLCLMGETPDFYKFSYLRIVGGDKGTIKCDCKFIYLSKTTFSWDMGEDNDIPNDDKEIQNNII